MKSKMSNKEIVPPKPKAKFPEGKKRTGRDDYSKEIVPPREKMSAFGGKKDKETQEQDAAKKFPARTPDEMRVNSKEMRRLKREYKV